MLCCPFEYLYNKFKHSVTVNKINKNENVKTYISSKSYITNINTNNNNIDNKYMCDNFSKTMYQKLTNNILHYLNKHTEECFNKTFSGVDHINDDNISVDIKETTKILYCNKPAIGISRYISRFYDYKNNHIYDYHILIMVIIYTKRLLNKKLVIINNHTIHKLFASLSFIAYKFIEDTCYNIQDISYIAGMSIQTITDVEIHLLKLMNFNIYISEKEYFNELNLCLYFIND